VTDHKKSRRAIGRSSGCSASSRLGARRVPAERDPGTIRMPQPLPRRRREHRYHGGAIARVYVLAFFGSPRRCPFGISPWPAHQLLSGKHMGMESADRHPAQACYNSN
jgi:hypothetical protein